MMFFRIRSCENKKYMIQICAYYERFDSRSLASSYFICKRAESGAGGLSH